MTKPSPISVPGPPPRRDGIGPVAETPTSILTPISPRTPRQSCSGTQQNAFTRLLFHPGSSTTQNKPLPRPPQKYLKTRIITWNMHESLPKGDLEELLGKVPAYSPPPQPSADPLDAPALNSPSLDEHPYHLVVIAGQECPSVTGILPMGLGAGFKLKDLKEREKEREKEKERDVKLFKVKDKEKDDHDHLEFMSNVSLPIIPHTGWSTILDDWLCKGIGSNAFVSPRSKSSTPGARHGHHATPEKSAPTTPSPGWHLQDTDLEEHPLGPYELLVKERMMGLYLAVYIYRDLRPLVQGTSKSSVTAGLIGGRVGNKGGVAISLNVAGTTLLFVNAHLAAHEGKVASRLANMTKIKNELSVNDFLSPDDPRVMAEDITDKFDFSFIFGDLNFRLDISRLHADWLISRQDYRQALTFDQLRNLMDKQAAFVGFNEAPINFPPTFKYDVLRSSKRRGRPLSRRYSTVPKGGLDIPPLSEGEDHCGVSDDDEEDEGEVEATSVISSRSAWTSLQSKTAGDDEDDYFHLPIQTRANAVAHKVHNLWHGEARIVAHKAKERAKERVRSMLSPTGSSPIETPLWKRHSSRLSHALNLSLGVPPTPMSSSSTNAVGAMSSPDLQTNTDHSLEMGSPQPSEVARAHSTRAILENATDDADVDKGVYDSSHKRRVPSWCDRILWKSTVQPDSEPEDEALDGSFNRPRTRVGQLLALAFRRNRRDSYSSSTSSESGQQAVEDVYTSHVPPTPPPELEESLSAPPPAMNPLSPSSASRSRRPVSALPMPRSQTLEGHQSGLVSRQFSYGDLRGRMRPFTGIGSLLAGGQTQSSASLVSPSSPYGASPVDLEVAVLSPAAENSVQPQPPVSSSPAFRRFLPFFAWDRNGPLAAPEQPSTPVLERRPLKGDVICLNYNTLDDKAMRRLEGRSDHRPVMGTYAIYL